MLAIESNNFKILEDDSASIDFYVQDNIYVKLMQDKKMRKNLLISLNKTKLIIERLGSKQENLFIYFSDRMQVKDNLTILTANKEVGYYARV